MRILNDRLPVPYLVDELRALDDCSRLARTDDEVVRVEDARQTLIAMNLPIRILHRDRSYRIRRRRLHVD